MEEELPFTAEDFLSADDFGADFQSPPPSGDSGKDGASAGSHGHGVPGRREKRKREEAGTPNDEDEIARRRRRRQSLTFHQRRRSLTLTSKAKPKQNRQYISDMYSTIIKMSSENKINVKNSWSLHLIDHMEDILESPRAKDGEEDEDPDGTFNFQKASCTLDASIKIYSYRVDDTWNSSYKILENLSRNESKHGVEEAAEDAGDAPRKSRKVGAAAKTIEKNLNNINLKTYETEFEADPLFHKMSQSFDEGGAKGMLLANLSVYDGCKILLNSSDVSVSTRKSMVEEPTVKTEEGEKISTDEKDETASDKAKPDRLPLSCFGDMSCLTQDVQLMEVCPPLARLYDQIEEYYGDEARLKVGLKNEFLLKTPVKGRRAQVIQDDKITMNLGGILENAAEDDSDAEEADDVVMDGFEPDGDVDEDQDGVPVDAEDEGDHTASDVNGNVDMDGEHLGADGTGETLEGETAANDESDSAVKLEPATATAADFFRSRIPDTPKNQDANLLTQMIEKAVVRSASLADDGVEGFDGIGDYSYFDVKMLRNWAGPVHWKFPTVRKVQSKAQVEKSEKDASSTGEGGPVEDEDGSSDLKSESSEQLKKSTAADKKSVLVDFFADVPDLDALLKPPSSTSSLVLSKLVVKRQEEKASELVLPVDTHIKIGLFFQRFLKPKLKYFKRQVSEAPSRDFTSIDFGASPSADARKDEGDESFGGGFGDDGYGYDGGYDDDGDSAVGASQVDEITYSTDGLVAAERMVEKIDVHYERVAKRVDVKKLKNSIWDHLGKDPEVVLTTPKKKAAENEATPVKNDSGKRPREEEAEADVVELDTTFENVVESVANDVPSNVTVSFYFICMLHLANEKGLKLTGQDDLCNFQIQKD